MVIGKWATKWRRNRKNKYEQITVSVVVHPNECSADRRLVVRKYGVSSTGVYCHMMCQNWPVLCFMRLKD